MTTFTTHWRSLLSHTHHITANHWVDCTVKYHNISISLIPEAARDQWSYWSNIFITLSTHCLVPVRHSVVVVLQEPAAVFRQALYSLQPQPTGKILPAAGPHSSTTSATSATQCTHPTQLQHRRHENISQPAVPGHGGNCQKGSWNGGQNISECWSKGEGE